MLKEIWLNRKIIFRLSIVDFKSFFKTSILSYFWVFISPALMIGMYLFSFAAAGSDVEEIPIINFSTNTHINFIDEFNTINVSKIGWLIIGVLTWSYIGSILASGSNSIRTYNWLVTKVGTPLSTPPMLVNVSKSYIGIASIFVSWIIYMIIAGVNKMNGANLHSEIITTQILQLPFMVILLFIFMALWSLITSPLTAISKDVLNVIAIVPMLLQWITGVFLPLNQSNMNSALGVVFRINPFNFLISNIRNSIMGTGYFWTDGISLISFFSFFLLMFLFALFINKRSKTLVVDLV